MVARRHDQGMDTHLTPTNEAVVREREDAMRVAHERATATFRARTDAADTTDSATQHTTPGTRARGRGGGGADVLVVTLFAVLASGLVSLVVTSLRVG
jgi:hypothetical protein